MIRCDPFCQENSPYPCLVRSNKRKYLMTLDSRNLGKLGLEGDAAKAYKTLQVSNPLALDELALHAKIHRDKILGVAKELERAKLIELSSFVICQISDNVMTISKGIQRTSPRLDITRGKLDG